MHYYKNFINYFHIKFILFLYNYFIQISQKKKNNQIATINQRMQTIFDPQQTTAQNNAQNPNLTFSKIWNSDITNGNNQIPATFINISQYKNIDVKHLFCSTNNDIYLSNIFFFNAF